jgi:exonuclease III
MRLVAWNCQMAFRKKYTAVEAFKPDILVISECESPAFLAQKGATLPWPNFVWIGDNPNKGLGVFARKGLSLRLLPKHNPDFRYVAPIRVAEAFDLFAVWTQGNKTPSKSYVEHMLRAMYHYGPVLGKGTIIAGDFNSNPVFKQNGKKHVELVELLAQSGLESVFHRQTLQAHGNENTPTFFLHRNLAKPYHLDYVFCEAKRKAKVEIGAPDNWLSLSDHMPLIADF